MTKAKVAFLENQSRRVGESGLALESMSRVELEDVFLYGKKPQLEALVGWDFCGLNVPEWAKYVGVKKFIKGFYRDGKGDVYGYNCPAKQNQLFEEWTAGPNDTTPKRFGFYRVRDVEADERDNKYLHALILNYGEGGNPLWDPTQGLRDYLVQVYPDNPNLYLGKAYYAVGPARIYTNFFILERRSKAPCTLSR